MAEITLYKLASGKAESDPTNIGRSAASTVAAARKHQFCPSSCDKLGSRVAEFEPESAQQFEFGIELFLSAAAQRELCLACAVSHTRTKSGQAMTGLLTCE